MKSITNDMFLDKSYYSFRRLDMDVEYFTIDVIVSTRECFVQHINIAPIKQRDAVCADSDLIIRRMADLIDSSIENQFPYYSKEGPYVSQVKFSL